MGSERREYNDASCFGFNGYSVRMVVETFVAQRFDIFMGKRYLPMHYWDYPWAAVSNMNVNERIPASEALVRLDKSIPVILMPRESSRFFCLFVNQLVPIQSDIWANQIMTNISKGLLGDKLFYHF